MKRSIFLLLFLLTFVLSCGGSQDNRPQNARFNRGPQAASVETITIERGEISQQIRSYGNIKAQEVVSVTPQVSNRVTRIYADLGDTVRQGEVLAQIYDQPFKDQVDQSQAQLRQNLSSFRRDSIQYFRQKKLFEEGLISSTEFENAEATYQNSKAALEASRASLEQSRENLRNSEIRSPVYGVVLTRNISEGDLASSGQVAYEIANLVGYETRVYLPVEEWQMVDVGQEVSLRVSNRSAVSGRGRVSRISPRLDPTTGLGEVVISLTERGSGIYQGVLVESIINVETHPDALIIPRAALVENVQTLIEPESNTIQINRTYSAFVVRGDTQAVKRELELGIEQGNNVEVLAGLQAGDEVVITGQSGLEDGARVRVARGQQFQRGEIPIETGEMSEERRQEIRERYRDADDSTRRAMREQLEQRGSGSTPDTSSSRNSSN
ncbi:MAG: efflux RND transporter periplasmic adaptor subunit [Balneolaceae bacterium]|nr:efflux RND transporter periplasmic adaptor subunit [Balneolaceae bacterium]